MAKPSATRRGAQRARGNATPLFSGIQQYFGRHLQEALVSLGKLWRAPLATLLTVVMIGIALSLPAGLGLFIQHLEQASQGWDGKPQISLFLKKSLSKGETKAFRSKLGKMQGVEKIQWIDAERALEEFKISSGFGDALNNLSENPLPNVIALWPAESHSQSDALQKMVAELASNPAVDIAQLDLAWVQKLQAITVTLERATTIVALLLAIAVLLTVGNTIRLEVQNRRDEIEVAKLIGATHGFIRRPFLYTGFWYGTLGGIIAWLLLMAALLFLQGPVAQVAALYHSQFRLELPGITDSLLLLFASAALGLVGAWLSVSHHIKEIEPQ